MRERKRGYGNLGLSAFEKSYNIKVKNTKGREVIIPYNDLTKVMGKLRLEQYRKTGRNLERIVSYLLTQDITEKSEDGFQANMIGAEGNVFAIENLRRMRAKSIQMEVPYKDTALDVVANVNSDVQMNFVTKDGKEISKPLPKGDNVFEVKSSVTLSKKAVRQIEKARGQYKNCHVLVLADTSIPQDIIHNIYKDKCDIIRATFTREDLMQRLLKVQKDLRSLVR